MIVIAGGKNGISLGLASLKGAIIVAQPPVAGTTLSYICRGVDKMRVVADGAGGSTEQLFEANSLECGYVAPPTGENLLAYSENLDNDTIWTGGAAIITANVANDPGGELTADRVLVNSGSWYRHQSFTAASLAPHTVSMYVKSNTGANQTFRLYGDNSIVSGNLTATTTWQQFTFTFTPLALATNAGVCRNSTNGTNDLLVAWAQVNKGTIAKTYTKTTGTPVV